MPLSGSKRAATANETAPLLDRGHDDVVKRDRFTRARPAVPARPFQTSPEAGAQTSVYLATSPEVAEVSGRYFEKCTPAESSALSRDPAAAERLWQLSTQLSGLDAELPTTG
jgi:hypothetical protein